MSHTGQVLSTDWLLACAAQDDDEDMNDGSSDDGADDAMRDEWRYRPDEEDPAFRIPLPMAGTRVTVTGFSVGTIASPRRTLCYSYLIPHIACRMLPIRFCAWCF
jgi:hypothetical protein